MLFSAPSAPSAPCSEEEQWQQHIHWHLPSKQSHRWTGLHEWGHAPAGGDWQSSVGSPTSLSVVFLFAFLSFCYHLRPSFELSPGVNKQLGPQPYMILRHYKGYYPFSLQGNIEIPLSRFAVLVKDLACHNMLGCWRRLRLQPVLLLLLIQAEDFFLNFTMRQLYPSSSISNKSCFLKAVI